MSVKNRLAFLFRRRVLGFSVLGSIFCLFVLLLSACTSIGSMRVSGYRVPVETHDDDEFTLVSWNVHKNKHPDLPLDLHETLQVHQPDLVFLQEARPGSLEVPHLEGTLAVSWRHPLQYKSEVGVFTASALETIEEQAFRSKSRELGITVPKSALMTKYALSNGSELLAVNVHALNFEKGEPKRFISQMQTLHGIMKLHEGPMIFAGDFNTWNEERNAYLLELAAGLNMHEVTSFVGERKTGDHGWMNNLLGINPELPLDRVFFRGLEVVSAEILDLDSSDHDPLVVRFQHLPPNTYPKVAMAENRLNVE